MLRLCTSLLFFVVANFAQAQQNFDLVENKPLMNNGLEIGYEIKNEQNKDEYSRYEITIFVSNKTGCHKFYVNDERPQNTFSRNYTEPDVVAVFDCLNATGKRLTSKGGQVKANPFLVPVSVSETKDGKTTSQTNKIQAGFILRNGDSISNDFIVIVPLGERPKFKCRLINASEL